MSVLLALTAVIVLILIDVWRRSRKPVKVETSVLIKRYVHPGHTWLRETEDGDVFVGMDDFAQSLIGSIDGVELPRLLHKVRQGAVAWRVRHENRVVPMLSPVTGRVVEKNEMVLTNPRLINTSPFGDAWLLRVRPTRLPDQLHNLMTGKQIQPWIDAVKSRLNRVFSGTPALLYQDGGVLMTNLADRCSDDEWAQLVKELFLIDEH
ncbi:MAG: glycine cleavage system protein H [Bacteroidota bacterium]